MAIKMERERERERERESERESSPAPWVGAWLTRRNMLLSYHGYRAKFGHSWLNDIVHT